MALRERLEKQGNFLFMLRSYFPLLLLPVVLLALRNSECLEHIFGKGVDGLWEVLCVLLSFFGLFIRCFTVGYVPHGTSGRNTKGQLANVLNTTGMYSVVRNPLYFGNFIIVAGLLLFIQVWWLVLITIIGFWVYYERIIFAEEEFLREKFGDQFLTWAEKTPIFWPRFGNWQKPNMPVSFKAVLRREFSTFFAIVASFTFIDIAADLFSEGKLEMDVPWRVFFITGLTIYLFLKILKQKTCLLNVEGR